ncbi:MAG: hypothetical protein ACOCXQ_01415 [Patescibacteria group bacterium]
MDEPDCPFSSHGLSTFITDVEDLGPTSTYLAIHRWGWQINRLLRVYRPGIITVEYRPLDIVWGFYHIAGVWSQYGISSEHRPFDIPAIIRLLRDRGYELAEDNLTRSQAYHWWNEVYDNLQTYGRITLGCGQKPVSCYQLPHLEIAYNQITLRQLQSHLRTERWMLQESLVTVA